MASSRWERLLEELFGAAKGGGEIADKLGDTPPPPGGETPTTLGLMMWITFGFIVIGEGMLEGIREKTDGDAPPGWQRYYRFKKGASSLLVVLIIALLAPLIPFGWISFFIENFWTMPSGRPPIGVVPTVIFCLIALVMLRILFGYASGAALPQTAEGRRDLPGSPAKRMWRRVFAWAAFAVLGAATTLIAYGYWRDNF